MFLTERQFWTGAFAVVYQNIGTSLRMRGQDRASLRSGSVTTAMRMTTESSPGGSEVTMDDVKNLIKKKDEIEEQIKAYYDVLEDVSFFFLNTQFNIDSSM